MIRVSVFNEFCHERHKDAVKAIYPDGMHKTIADFLRAEEDITARTCKSRPSAFWVPIAFLDFLHENQAHEENYH
ncbi:MAG: hypothetical protein IKC43_04685 [Clostridia bacterium]|nr:hypothetical protein [Clostridia bacterium]